MRYTNINQSSNSYPVVKNLLIINVLMLLITLVFYSQFKVDLKTVLGLFYFKSEQFHPIQIVTHMFMHGGFPHLFFNMFALWMFGRILENVWGSKRFLIYYMVTGLGAAALHTLVNHIQINSMIETANALINTPEPSLFKVFVNDYMVRPIQGVELLLNQWPQNPDNSSYIQRAREIINQIVVDRMNIPTVGASGAVFGVLLAFGMLFPNTRLLLLFPPIPIKAKYFVIGYGVIELYLGFSQPGSNVAHFAHIGGMLFGFLLIKYWDLHNIYFY